MGWAHPGSRSHVVRHTGSSAWGEPGQWHWGSCSMKRPSVCRGPGGGVGGAVSPGIAGGPCSSGQRAGGCPERVRGPQGIGCFPRSKPPRVSSGEGTGQSQEVGRDHLWRRLIHRSFGGNSRFLLFSLGDLHVCHYLCFLETSYRKVTPF